MKDIKEIVYDFAKRSPRRKPYNLFAEWRMSENDHTKFLLAILRYSDGTGYYPLLHSFLVRFAKGKDKMVHYKRPNGLEIHFNKERLDGLITFNVNNKSFAIILENKIHGAIDQSEQINRYIKSCLANGTELENIWAFYITSDGEKEIDDRSYNPRNEESEVHIGRRFVPINYRYDILPWLKCDVLKTRTYPESLTSVVRQYVDFLESDMFCEDALQSEQDALLHQLGLPSALYKMSEANVMDLYKLRKQLLKEKVNQGDGVEQLNPSDVNEVYSVLSSILKAIENYAFSSFERITKEILQERWCKKMKKDMAWTVAHRGISCNGINSDEKDRGYVQMRLVDDWGTIHMEWENIGTISMLYKNQYSLALHFEGAYHNALWREQLKPRILPNGVVECRRGFRYNIKSECPLAKMCDDKLREYLKKIYTEDLDKLFELLVVNYGNSRIM